MSKFGLPQQTVDIIHTILAKEPAIQKAILYGSRAKGTHKNGSDIDLTLIGEHLTETSRMRIAEKLDDAPIPYQVDLSLLAHISNKDLKNHIQRVGKIFYTRTSLPTPQSETPSPAVHPDPTLP